MWHDAFIHTRRDSFVTASLHALRTFALSHLCACMWHDSHVSRLIHMRHDSFVCDMEFVACVQRTCLVLSVCVYDMTHTCHDWLIFDMTHSCMTWRSLHVPASSCFPCVCGVCVTWRICVTTHSYVTYLIYMWHDSFVQVKSTTSLNLRAYVCVSVCLCVFVCARVRVYAMLHPWQIRGGYGQ